MIHSIVEVPQGNGTANVSIKQSLSREVEQKSFPTDCNIGARNGADEHPPLTLKRLLALFSLTLLFMTAAVPVYFLTATLGIPLEIHTDGIAFVEADIGGGNSVVWLGMANTLATAATAPFAGSISGLLGRRYVALLGSSLVIIGVIITGTATQIDVAIGGMAIVGVGAGLAEVIAAAGVMELAPVKRRGTYVGISFLLYLPISAGQMYGNAPPRTF